MRPQNPWKVVASSVAFYSFILSSTIHLDHRGEGGNGLRTKVRAVSAAHSAATALCALYILKYGQWNLSADLESRQLDKKRSECSGRLDDSANPVIAGKSNTANALTAWENGYLIYDTFALLFEASRKHRTRGILTPVSALTKNSPVFFAHHLALIAALSCLQQYIAKGREKGVWVIVALLAMNASNPLLHLRWWFRKTTGQPNLSMDIMLAVVFAISRFGNTYWILKTYGTHHGISPRRVCSQLRWQCQTGTGLLVGLNAIWWLGLTRSIFKRGHER